MDNKGDFVLNELIFKEYDIRGRYPDEINEEVAYLIGQGFGSYLQEQQNRNEVVVGHDNRLSSEDLNANLIRGITSTGCNVIDIGLCTTPMNYYGRYITKNVGIMITASHNPKDDNGFKFGFDVLTNARGNMIRNFKDYVLKGEFLSGKGKVTKRNITNDYINYLKEDIMMGKRNLKVIVDCGNGTTSILVKKVFNTYNFDVEYLYCDSDGTFPNHHPDPVVEENIKDLKQAVYDQDADVGLAFDGDGDRIAVVTSEGKFLPSDYLMIIFVRDLIDKVDNKSFLFDVKCSKTLEDEIIKLGANPVSFRVGASYNHAKVVMEKIPFGGEYSGHIWFGDKGYVNSSAIYVGLRLLEILSNTNKTINQLLEGINEYKNYPEEKFRSSNEKKFEVVNKIKQYAIDKGYSINDIDGVRVNFTDGWGLVRASNTGPDITTRFEATSEERLQEIRNEFVSKLEEFI